MDRVTAINVSLRGFVCGILACVPVIGLLPGLYALICWSQVRRQYKNEWNPASAYLKAGVILGSLGLLSSVLIAFFIGLSIVTRPD